ncbi:MAG: hypothetical protein IPK60_23800 [Sandaracinaceae bacterium]|nr:hypothetical protein [Sandaracinaceae bacterium]
MECKECGNEVESLVAVKIGGKKVRVCEDCADRAREEDEVAEAATGVMKGMMEYKGK